jgi:hypothetical protein
MECLTTFCTTFIESRQLVRPQKENTNCIHKSKNCTCHLLHHSKILHFAYRVRLFISNESQYTIFNFLTYSPSNNFGYMLLYLLLKWFMCLYIYRIRSSCIMLHVIRRLHAYMAYNEWCKALDSCQEYRDSHGRSEFQHHALKIVSLRLQFEERFQYFRTSRCCRKIEGSMANFPVTNNYIGVISLSYFL